MGKRSTTHRWKKCDRLRRFRARQARHARNEIGKAGHQEMKIVVKREIPSSRSSRYDYY